LTLLYLLDTNVLSEPVKPMPNLGVMRLLEAHRAEIATAAPVWNELLFGCFRLPASKRRTVLEEYLRETLAPSLAVLPYDGAAAERHAAERARLSLLGRTPPFIDGQIAAVAQTCGLTLVTRNVSDYEPFEDLRIENWAE
jgi:tRNA(fMet)-specific endonuclease VapC